MPERSVSAGYAAGLIELAVSKGANRTALAAHAQIDLIELQDRDNRIPIAKYALLMRAAQQLCKDPALALHFGEAVNIAKISIIGLIGQASETVLDAFAQGNRYARLVVDVDAGSSPRFQARNERGGLWVVDTRINPNDFPELTESAFAQIVCWSRQIIEMPLVKELHVTHPAPAYRTEYDRIFRAPVVFASDRNAILINPAATMQRIALLPRYVFGVLTAHADALLKDLENTKSTRGSVENLLMPILHTGDASMDTIAGKLAVSRKTLFRKLKAEGVTFEKVLDELRHKMALEYLRGKKVSVNETAYLVGFSDPTGFSRAFKRWTGTRPRAMRAPNAIPSKPGCV